MLIHPICRFFFISNAHSFHLLFSCTTLASYSSFLSYRFFLPHTLPKKDGDDEEEKQKAEGSILKNIQQMNENIVRLKQHLKSSYQVPHLLSWLVINEVAINSELLSLSFK